MEKSATRISGAGILPGIDEPLPSGPSPENRGVAGVSMGGYGAPLASRVSLMAQLFSAVSAAQPGQSWKNFRP